MNLNKYSEKFSGKNRFILTSVIFIFIGVFSLICGILSLINLHGFARYALFILLILFSLILVPLGIFMLVMSINIINKSKVIDMTKTSKNKPITRLCSNCGKVISGSDVICKYCQTSTLHELAFKICPQCKTKNGYVTKKCEKCGWNFKQ